jgi:phage/plasmid primase-like uncharacterized protein
MNPTQTLDKEAIKSRVSIEMVLRYYGATPGAHGTRWHCPCPQNHNNGAKVPSVEVKDGLAFCWSQKCLGEKPTDIFGLIEVVEGHSDFKAQLVRACEIGGIATPNESLETHRDFCPKERQQAQERIEMAEKEKERDRLKAAEAAAKRANSIWDEASPVPTDHPYLLKKKIQSHGVRVHKGCVVIPAHGSNGTIATLQFIDQDGTKRFLKDGIKHGNYFAIGKPGGSIYLCEGFATGATIYQVTNEPVIVAFDAGNLKLVAERIRREHPAAKIILAADNDTGTNGNPGLTKAKEAAAAVGGVVVYPTFENEGTDFNDLFCSEGVEKVREQLQSTDEAKGHRFETVRETQTSTPWPILESDAFYGVAGEFAQAVAPYSEADPAGILLHMLVMSGCWIGAGPHALVEHQPHPPRLNALQVGRTASGRKGTAASHPKLLFSRLDPDWMKHRVKSGLSTGEGLTYLVRDQQMENVPIKEKGRHTGEFEAIVTDLGESDKRLLIIEPEFASVLKVMEREGSTLSPKIRDAWDHGNLSPLTKTDRTSATGAHICLIGHITVNELRRYLTVTERGNGFANRFLFALTKRAQFIPSGKGAPQEILNEYFSFFSRILRIAQGRSVLVRDPQCEEMWASIYPDLEAEMPELAGEILGRGAAQVLRLSLLYSLLDQKEAERGDPAIRTAHLLAALAVWDYCKASVFYIFGDAIGDPVADRLLRAIRVGPQTDTELYELLGKHSRDGARKGQALDLLFQLRKIHSVTVSTAGRPIRWWHMGESTGCALCAKKG